MREKRDSKSKSKEDSPNVRFYKNEIPAAPYDEKIEDILIKWTGNYVTLEREHGYIQWLFPNRVIGVNPRASVLTDEDVKAINDDPKLKERVKRSFEMMLDFYGMKLVDGKKIEPKENSVERFKELNRSYNHNFLRVTRILLALKELGHSDLMLPWLKFMVHHIYETKKLSKAQSSFENFWIKTLNDQDKFELKQYTDDLLSQKPPNVPTQINSQSETSFSTPENIPNKRETPDEWGYHTYESSSEDKETINNAMRGKDPDQSTLTAQPTIHDSSENSKENSTKIDNMQGDTTIPSGFTKIDNMQGDTTIPSVLNTKIDNMQGDTTIPSGIAIEIDMETDPPAPSDMKMDTTPSELTPDDQPRLDIKLPDFSSQKRGPENSYGIIMKTTSNISSTSSSSQVIKPAHHGIPPSLGHTKENEEVVKTKTSFEAANSTTSTAVKTESNDLNLFNSFDQFS